ncbi:MAG: sigma-70 family RNA polymerase sigma factor [Tannerellaceae bacterium]|nr:sigma-70 family RNA polymerase sigma factor [Tannerellaceae bacterium]
MNATQANKDNLEKLIAIYQPLLKSFIRKRVRHTEDVEDILQDVFYQLVKTVETAVNPIEQTAAWLYRVTRNTIINRGKKKQEEELPASRLDDEGFLSEEPSEILFAGAGEPATPEMEYLRSLVWQELEAALSELPPEQREAFEQMELNGLPAKEVAQIAGVPLATLLSRKRSAVMHLRKRLKALYEDILSY